MMSRAGRHSSGGTKKIRIGSAWKHRAAFATVASCSCKMRLLWDSESKTSFKIFKHLEARLKAKSSWIPWVPHRGGAGRQNEKFLQLTQRCASHISDQLYGKASNALKPSSGMLDIFRYLSDSV